MRIPRRTGAVHRPRRPIIGSPDAQPAATPDPAVGDGPSFLRLPRHPRPLPVSRGRPPQPRRRRGRHDVLDRPCRSRAAAHRGARRACSSGSEGRVPSPWLLGAIGAFALLIVVSAIPNGAGAVAAAGKLAEFAVLALGAAAFVDTRPRFGDPRRISRRLLRRRRRVGRGRVRRQRRRAPGLVHGRARPRGALDDGARARLGVPLPPRPACRPQSGSSGSASARSESCSARRWPACSASTSPRSRWSRSRSSAATFAAAPSSSPSLICAAVTAGTYGVRSADLGFLQSWFGPPPETPGQYAASWSHRLIYVYIGGRVFLDNPIVRHRLGGRAAAGGLRAVPRRRPRAVPRPAAALLPARDRHADPAADLRPGAVRARSRRRGGLPRPHRCWRSAMPSSPGGARGRGSRGESRRTFRWAGSP